MTFSLFLPDTHKFPHPPLLWWLSGLSSTDDNFTHKAGAQRTAAELGIAILIPDTSPRGEHVADDPEYDLGQGAGFYLDATEAPWSEHYQMYRYLTEELSDLIKQHFTFSGKEAISGHSMGGHGALVIGLKNPTRFSSISAFAPILSPSQVPWGIRAFTNYLGKVNQISWKNWDASELIQAVTYQVPILIHQGRQDPFLAEQLDPAYFLSKTAPDYPLTYHLVDGYDHSYYFVASFIEAHLRFHAQHF